MKDRLNALYEYLLDRGDEWTTHADLAMDLDRFYGNGECFLAPKDYHNTAERSLITKDCRAISVSSDFEKIIISGSKGIKLATEDEFNRFIKAQYDATIRKLARIYKMAKKGSRNCQIDFGGNTVEAFLNGIDDGLGKRDI